MTRLTLFVALLVSLVVQGTSMAQEVSDASGERGPRFLLASAAGRVPLDASRAPVLARRLTFDLEGVTRKAALAEIARQAGLKLVYGDKALKLDELVRLKADGITVAAALTDVLLDTGVDVVFSSNRQVALVKRPERAALPNGGAIAGRVTDGKTQAALAGATVVVQGTSRSATTGTDGRYRIADMAPGTYTVRARYIGYTPGSASVTVSADQEATADFTLEKSAQRLDEVVTTGTVIPTEVKALPTPISVITGDELQQKGYQRIDQIFRGDVPGVIAWDHGAGTYYSDINIRGASSADGTNYVKTYVDGVEVADPYFIATIDPNSIERIEVLRGPQASTIYGSQALSGVMRIFTKKGTLNTSQPQVDAKVSAGVIQSQWQNTTEQDHSLGVSGGSNDISYRFGGGYGHSGDWVPEAYATNASLYGSSRITQGPLTVELSARYYSHSFGTPFNPAFSQFSFYSKPMDESRVLQQQTYGLNLEYRATPRWQHNLVLGYDRGALGTHSNHPRLLTPADSFLSVFNTNESKPSVAYNTTYEVSLDHFQSSLTAGVDHYTYYTDFYGGSTAGGRTTLAPAFASRSQYNNTGYFAQAQLGFWDAVFVTAGMRAEDNQSFGTDFGLAWSPRVGMSYVRTVGNVTAKARVAYGKAIRPPTPGSATPIISSSLIQLANPNLGPEQERGWDGGLDLYFGTRASLEATYYNQTAIDLIAYVLVDPSAAPPVYQNQNVGRIKNKGWEFQGQVNAGPISLAGTYSIVGSTVLALAPSYTGDLKPGDQMLHIPKHTGGVTLSYRSPHTAVSLGMTYVGSWVETDYLAIFGFYYGGQPYRGSGRAYWTTYPSFTKFNVSVVQPVIANGRLGVFLRSDNLTNKSVVERDSYYGINSGRVTVVGLQTRF